MLCPNCGIDNIPGEDSCESCGTDLAGLDLPEAGSGFRGRMLSDRIGDLRLSPAVTVAPDCTVEEAIQRMRQARSGCVLVADGGELLGIFNERHVLTRVLRETRDPAATAITEVMSAGPLALSPEDPPAHAVHCMVDYGFRHLPVVADGKILGYVSVRNILDYIHNELSVR